MQNIPTSFDPTGSQCSEKYDGIHGCWDGKTLTTRTGNTINAPAWWTSSLPAIPLVGELWLGRGTFDTLRSIVCRDTPDDRWQSVRYMVFDGGDQGNDLGPYAEPVIQTTIESPDHLTALYETITNGGGEGVVVTDQWGDQFKRKPTQDDDGILVGTVPGAGKNEGLVGALVLKNRAGQTVKVSAGLTAALRENPPSVGAVIRYRFNGLTSSGLPRFARFDGVRAETSLDF